MNNQRSSVSTYFLDPALQLFPSKTTITRYRILAMRILVLAVMAILTCSSIFAQVRFGTVLGMVSDTTGATVSGANVKLTNLGTNEARTMQTASGGFFTFPNLNAGLYKVDIEMSGFKHFTQDKVEVQVDVATRVDAALQVGNIAETVLVTTEAPPPQTA